MILKSVVLGTKLYPYPLSTPEHFQGSQTGLQLCLLECYSVKSKSYSLEQVFMSRPILSILRAGVKHAVKERYQKDTYLSVIAY